MINTDDKQPSEHSELPWIIEGNRLMDNSGRNTIAVFVQGWSDDDANMQFVKEACNNYETLKAQNERLVKVLEDRFVSHNEVPPGEMPMCVCGNLMIAVKARLQTQETKCTTASISHWTMPRSLHEA